MTLFFRVSFSLSVIIFASSEAFSQARKQKAELFAEDVKEVKDARSDQAKRDLATDKGANKDLDIQAPSVEMLKDSKQVKGTGGVLISNMNVQAQAETAVVNVETKDSQLDGTVVVSGPDGAINSDSAYVNLDDETGEFKNADFLYEEGGYSIKGRDVYKLSETRYKLFDSKFSTCHCQDGTCPWSINSDEARITQEGYAHTWGTSLSFYGVPLFYSPYFAFPAKLERTSGLLVPDFGYSDRDGIQFKQPIFVVIDDSTDITVSPFVFGRTRNGAEFDIRKAVSLYNNIHTKWIYSNERPRDGDLRGTNVDGILAKEIDDDRIGGMYSQIWRASPESVLPYRILADVHYVSDNLFLREMEDDDIGETSDQYTVSRLVARSAISDFLMAEISGEYNQTLYGEQDFQLQRIPEISISELKSFRPFGANPYGLKVVTKATLTGTEFSRDDGYDGFRTDLNPSITIPFHFENYVSAFTGGGYRHTIYNLDQTNIPTLDEFDVEGQLDPSQNRDVPYFGSGVATSVERVYDVPEDSALRYFTSLGSSSQLLKLVRVKHVVEPFFKHLYVPDVAQDELPFFDSMDRMKHQNLVLYGVKTSLLGRFIPRKTNEPSITELTPEIKELPSFDQGPGLSDFGENAELPTVLGDVSLREGEIRSLLDFTVKQGYDFAIANEAERTDGIYPTTDVNFAFDAFPTKSLTLSIDSNFNSQESRFTSWGAGIGFTDDRHDRLIARFNQIDPTRYADPTLSEIDAGAEIVLTERLKFAFFTRFDEKESLFINNRMALRILSSCNCWHLDLGYADKSNPDKHQIFLTFTFGGLGDISQGFGILKKDDN